MCKKLMDTPRKMCFKMTRLDKRVWAKNHLEEGVFRKKLK